jgi:Monooxygenase af470-like
MNRVVARLPETVTELCLVRMGIQVHRPSAWLFARRLRSRIITESRGALADGAGLLCSEAFTLSIKHFGFLQYWRGFDEMEAWSRRPPHSEWWRKAVERMRVQQDLGIYHEAFLVRAAEVESIYMDCQPTGLGTFGQLAEPVGPLTTSRGRLGRSRS